jgi:DNA-directed RNA polymerase subunit L/DNA-directed RNA polymerase alpha subunit
MFTNYVESGPTLLGDSSHNLRGTFRFTNTNMTMANTIRRAILALTPSVGFRTEPYDKSDVIITVNTTPLPNEMISHRIGMIPVKVPDLVTFDASKYEFILDKENTTKELMDVHASDFKVFMKNPENPLDEPVQLPTEDFFPPDPITGSTVLITRLRPQWNPTAPNERISLKAKASISTGSENIRWSPVSQCSYEYTLDPDPAHQDEVFRNWLITNKKIDTLGATTVEGGEGEGEGQTGISEERMDELRREFKTMEIQRCYLKNEKGEPYDFTFYVESIGLQNVQTIVKNAIAACEALVTKYQDIDGVIPESVRIQQGQSRFTSMDVIFQNEGHTLGNLLETYLINEHVNNESGLNLGYAGYKVPHPLRPEMFVRIGFPYGSTGTVAHASLEDVETQKRTAQLAIATVCRKLKEEFRSLQSAWASVFAGPEGASDNKGSE